MFIVISDIFAVLQQSQSVTVMKVMLAEMFHFLLF
jgi:hypothetical protein